jgi:phosphoglucomutase/phosphomannomutase
MNRLPTEDLSDTARIGFAGLPLPGPVQEAAIRHLESWLFDPAFQSYRPQIVSMIERGHFSELLDAFYRVLPFGTGGRRGTVGIGPNRFNAWTLGASVQGHAQFLRTRFGEGAELKIVIAHDVRCFQDMAGRLIPGVPDPLRGMHSRDFAHIAAEIYAAADIQVFLPPEGEDMSTPELSFAIRHLGAQGGLNISASHNPPDDNGGKFYNANGGQEIPPQDAEMAASVAEVRTVARMGLDRARAAGLIQVLPDGVHEAYIQANLACGRDATARSARIVFTALHGTAGRTVGTLLARAGFDVHDEPIGAIPDGSFPSVPFRAPNPEVPQSMDQATAHADILGADLVLACDPDADRLGASVRHHGSWRGLSGNEIAVLLTDYVLSDHAAGASPVVIKTEVTSSLVSRVAKDHGAQVIDHLLVGFKYIGDAMDQLEAHGSFAETHASLDDFAIGAEESHGVLVSTAMRDKDAAGGALLLAELASLEKDQGRTLIDTLSRIHERVGYVKNELASTVMRGATGRSRIEAIQASYRAQPPTTIGGRTVTAMHDRLDPTGPFGPICSDTDAASRDVLVFELGDRARVVLRPSGTEPKCKVYAEVSGPEGTPLSTAKVQVDAACRTLTEGFVLDMLARVDIRLPAWALRINDLVSVEDKVRFADEIIPTLVSKLADGEAPQELGPWLDAQLCGFGKDGRLLVADAIRAFVRAEKPPDPAALLSLVGPA